MSESGQIMEYDQTVNGDTINGDTINGDTINGNTINCDTINHDYDTDKLLKIINTGIKKTKNDYSNMDPSKIKENNQYLFEFIACGLEYIRKKNASK